MPVRAIPGFDVPQTQEKREILWGERGEEEGEGRNWPKPKVHLPKAVSSYHPFRCCCCCICRGHWLIPLWITASFLFFWCESKKNSHALEHKQRLPVLSLVMEMGVSLFIFKGGRVKELECCLAHHQKGNLCLNIWQEEKKTRGQETMQRGGGERELLFHVSTARAGGKRLHSTRNEGHFCMGQSSPCLHWEPLGQTSPLLSSLPAFEGLKEFAFQVKLNKEPPKPKSLRQGKRVYLSAMPLLFPEQVKAYKYLRAPDDIWTVSFCNTLEKKIIFEKGLEKK